MHAKGARNRVVRRFSSTSSTPKYDAAPRLKSWEVTPQSRCHASGVDSFAVLSAETYQYHATTPTRSCLRPHHARTPQGRAISAVGIPARRRMNHRAGGPPVYRSTLSSRPRRRALSRIAPAIARHRRVRLIRTRPFDVFGLPAISDPCGFTREGLPIGLQTAVRIRESACLAAGARLSAGNRLAHPAAPGLIANPRVIDLSRRSVI